MKTPKTFDLFAQTISVRKKDLSDTGLDGAAHLAKQEILLDQTLKGDYGQVVYYHEKVHLILDILGYSHLSRDERLVDGIANLWLQSEKSAKF